MVNDIPTVGEAARRFAHSLAPDQQIGIQEAMRFARWLGEERTTSDIRPPDIEAYVETLGVTTANAGARSDALKSFLTYAHKQKWLPERLASHVRVRKATVRGRTTGERTVESRPEIGLTADGIKSLEEELQNLLSMRPKVASDLRDAMADKDFRENAPLDAAREAQGQIEARIRELEATLRHAVVLDQQSATDVARLGSNIAISNLSTGAHLTYKLVNAAEARPTDGRLSVESPVGQAVIGHRAGEEVEVAAPSGRVRFRIESVSA